MSTKSPMIRLALVEFENLPNHPSFDPGSQVKRPDLGKFALTLLDQGRALVLPTEFNLTFKHHSEKSSPPSNNQVEVLSATIASSNLESLPWGSDDLPRPKPAQLDDEHWYARRSYHHNISVKRNAPGTASWEEFVYGLRDQHSKHEFDFTPNIYDARLICEWNEELNRVLEGVTRPTAGSPAYSHATMAIYEMCHSLPSIVGPRCFPVLVVTASCGPSEFVAVTVPVDISRFPGAFYSNGRHRKEGVDNQMKKRITLGRYCAVERLHKYVKQTTHTDKSGRVHSHESDGRVDGEEIEWIMATASDAKGNLPMVMQRMGIPGAVSKDVGLFLKWIHKVPDSEVREQAVGTSTARP